MWLWSGSAHSASSGQSAAWHFIGTPKMVTEKITAEQERLRAQGTKRRGWGAVKVRVTVAAVPPGLRQKGATCWETSIFPDKKYGCYLLPLKSAVRKKEGIFVHDVAEVDLRLL